VAAQTQVYLYNQRTQVVLLEAASSGKIRYNKVYAKELILHRGVDNLIEFAFVNQEQKPVDISNKEITARIINPDGKKILLQKTLVYIFPVTGIAGLRVSSEELDKLDRQLCYYSIEIPVDEFDYPVFVDAQGGARGVVRIMDSVLSSYVPSYELTIPDYTVLTAPTIHYSSSFYTKQQNFYTFQLYFKNYTGRIIFQGSTLSNFAHAYDITDSISFTNVTENRFYNIEGFHPFIRVKFETDDAIGSVTKILVR
jgi:hypothetical protein